MELYQVYVSYKAERFFTEERKELEQKIFELDEDHIAGSGMGFGFRDHHFMDLEEKQAKELVKKARKIKGVKVVLEKQEI